MELLNAFVSFLKDPQPWVVLVLTTYGLWAYAALFLVVFCETGLVFTPFLPGESLLFAAGAVTAATGAANPWVLFAVLLAAAVLGDTANYGIGSLFGHRILARGGRFLKPEYVERTQRFFDRYGGKAVILGRFVPFVRTFAPFLAGTGGMDYGKFLRYNLLGGLAWVSLAYGAGYAFGRVPWVARNMSVVALGIVAVSLLPLGVEFLARRLRKPA